MHSPNILQVVIPYCQVRERVAEAFDNVTFAHVDLGVRLQLTDVRRPWVPYADLALTYWPVRDVVKQAGKGASWWP